MDGGGESVRVDRIPTLRLQDAIEHVRNDFQLSDADAAVYVQLCVGGPAKVSDLADALSLHRNDVYRTAERLAARGLLQTTLERPVRYLAVDPGKAFDAEIEARLAAIDALRASRKEIAQVLAQVQAKAAPQPKNVYKVVQGRNEIYAARNQMLRDAERTIEWATTFAPAVSMAEVSGALEVIREKADAGVSVRALVRTTPESRLRLASLARHPNACIRHVDPPGVVRFFIVDGRELLMWVVNGDPGSYYARDEVAIQASAPGFIHAESLFFEQTWPMGVDVSQMQDGPSPPPTPG